MAKFKKKIERHKKALPDIPDHPQTDLERLAYVDLLSQIRRAGNEKHTSVEVLIVAATQKAALEDLNSRINGLESLTIKGSHSQESLHPLVKERRQLQSGYLQTLGKLLLTPRSKHTARVKEDDVDPMTGGLDDDNPILRAIS